MKLKYSLIGKSRNLNKISSLPNLKNLSKSYNDNNLNKINSTTNASVIKINDNNSVLIPINTKNYKILKKIKLNNVNIHDNNKSSFINTKNTFLSAKNINKKTIDIIENADLIIKERAKKHIFPIKDRKKLYRNVEIKLHKDLSHKNYTINLLKEKRKEIDKKEFIINQSLKIFDELYEKDFRKYNNFIKELKNKQQKEESILYKLKRLKEEKENILEEEMLLNKRLENIIEKKIKELMILKDYGSFFHEIIEKPFFYDEAPDIHSRIKNYERISNSMINIYEYKDKNNLLPKELEDEEILMKKYYLLEYNLLLSLRNKNILDKEIEKDKEYYNNELEIIKSNKAVYENNLNYLKNENNKINKEMKNYKIKKNENCYLNYFIQLNQEIDSNDEIPIINDQRYLEELIIFSKKIRKKLSNLENKINTYIFEIENIFEHGDKNDKIIINNLITRQKILNKREYEMSFHQKRKEIKNLKDFKIIEKAKKIVIKERRNIFDYPIINKNKLKITKIIRKDNNNENDINLIYSDNEEKHEN